MKPFCCGDRRDAELLRAASSAELSIDEVNPIWLKTPVAPFSAALIEGVEFDLERLISALADLEQRFDFVVVEGIGGWLVPIESDYFVADLAKQMGLPVLVVALNRLGCLSHTMLTVRSIAAHELTCAGVVLNAKDQIADTASTTNEAILRRISGVPILNALNEGMREFPATWRPLMRRHTNSGKLVD